MSDNPLASMTGFARHDGATDTCTWSWELKSVNNKGLDLRFRMPPGLDALELRLRKLTQERLARGSLTCNLYVEQSSDAAPLKVNEEALEQILDLSRALSKKNGLKQPRIDGLLALRGVLEMQDNRLQPDEALQGALERSFLEALAQLVKARRSEGEAMLGILLDQLTQILMLVNKAEDLVLGHGDMLRSRLREQLARLMEETPLTDQDRLYQEVALLVSKADVREELDRLKAHVEAGQELITAGSPAGRKLDFLAQEFTREANTLCSKSPDAQLTRLGLDLKAVIDQMREQIQNVE